MPSPALGVFSTLLQPGCLPQFLQDLTCALASALPLPRKRRPPPANHRVHPLLPTASGARVWRCSVRVGPWSHHTEEARGPSLGWQVINPPPPPSEILWDSVIPQLGHCTLQAPQWILWASKGAKPCVFAFLDRTRQMSPTGSLQVLGAPGKLHMLRAHSLGTLVPPSR